MTKLEWFLTGNRCRDVSFPWQIATSSATGHTKTSGVAVVDSVELRLASATAWVSPTPLRLPSPEAYSVLALVSGRSAVPNHQVEPPRGIERWHVLLWPK